MLKSWFSFGECGGGENTFQMQMPGYTLGLLNQNPEQRYFFPSPSPFPIQKSLGAKEQSGLRALASVGGKFGTILIVPRFNRCQE